MSNLGWAYILILSLEIPFKEGNYLRSHLDNFSFLSLKARAIKAVTQVSSWVCITAFIMLDSMVTLNDGGKSCWPWNWVRQLFLNDNTSQKSISRVWWGNSRISAKSGGFYFRLSIHPSTSSNTISSIWRGNSKILLYSKQ